MGNLFDLVTVEGFSFISSLGSEGGDDLRREKKDEDCRCCVGTTFSFLRGGDRSCTNDLLGGGGWGVCDE